MSDRGVLLTEDAARRVGRAVRAYESSLGARRAAVVRDGPTYVLILGGPTGSGGAGPYEAVLSTTGNGLAWSDGTSVVDVRELNGQPLAAGWRYRADLVGYSATGVPIFVAAEDCCAPAGGGGSHGSVPGVVTGCCPSNPIASRLYMTIAGSGPADGTYPLDYSGPGLQWISSGGDVGTCHGLGIRASAKCTGGVFAGFFGNDLNYVDSVLSSCSPFHFSCTQEAAGPAVTCGLTAGYTMTITDHDPSGGGADCFTGNCGGSVPATLYMAVGATAGCYGTISGTLPLSCQDAGSGHNWVASSPITVCGHTFTPAVGQSVAGGPPVLLFPGLSETECEAGFTCSPDFAATFDVDDGAGNTAVITVYS